MAQFYFDVQPDTPENARAFFGAICDTLGALEDFFRSNGDDELTLSPSGTRGIALILRSLQQELAACVCRRGITVIVPEEKR